MASDENLMGPPRPGPVVWVRGEGISVGIRVEDENDAEIVRIAMQIAERRRYGRKCNGQ